MRESSKVGTAVAIIFACLLSSFTLAALIAEVRLRDALPEVRIDPTSIPTSSADPRSSLVEVSRRDDEDPPSSSVPAVASSAPPAEVGTLAGPDEARLPPPVHLGSITVRRGDYHAFLTQPENTVRMISVGETAFGWRLDEVDATSFLFEKENQQYVVERR